MKPNLKITAKGSAPAKPKSLREVFQTALTHFLSFGGKLSVQRRKNDLRLCETLSLGDKRFLAVVLVDQQKFLVGGAGNSVALLAKLSSSTSSRRDEVHLL
ncbi:MAG TPA: flagellar biosynthetic protein FliO [Terriglobia bacterium]|nr:flagellar biosynthetic protein FliO [Terriglobia bacterium]